MADQLTVATEVVRPATDTDSQPRSPSTARLARDLGLRLAHRDELEIRRRRCGRGYVYYDARGQRIRDQKTIRRLSSLAVPPAYEDVRYAEDPSAHLQAVGRDAAG